MCYRDRSYCQGPCAFAECSRQITAEVADEAKRRDLPLAISDFRATCPSYVAPAGSETEGETT